LTQIYGKIYDPDNNDEPVASLGGLTESDDCPEFISLKDNVLKFLPT